jgi:hypothetical protein
MDARYDAERADMDERLASRLSSKTLVREQELILAGWIAML